jgi:hypothetical protein
VQIATVGVDHKTASKEARSFVKVETHLGDTYLRCNAELELYALVTDGPQLIPFNVHKPGVSHVPKRPFVWKRHDMLTPVFTGRIKLNTDHAGTTQH